MFILNLGSYFLLVNIVLFPKEKRSQFSHTQNLHSNYSYGSEKRVTSCNVWISVSTYIWSIQFKFIFLNAFAIYSFSLKQFISFNLHHFRYDSIELNSIIFFSFYYQNPTKTISIYQNHKCKCVLRFTGWSCK